MNNKKKNILVWVFTWAALLLVVLYSPIGSPDLYSSSDYYAGVPNADLGGSNIGSSPNFNQSGSDNEINVPDYSSAEGSTKLSTHYSSAAPTSGNASSGTNSYSVSQSQSYQNTQNVSQGGAGSGGSTFISNNSSSKGSGSDASSAVTMNSGGVTTLSTTLSSTLSSTPKQNTLSGPTGGGSGTDPGGDPNPVAIPISDGWVFLLLLAASYGIIKKRFFTNE